mmetsp:Transcript_19000/g.32460  ORF Transcript_19000/g.32460 Transcript_19000/m.32460 type:complete len:141 (+) Transcript_19000:1317-1739(+)
MNVVIREISKMQLNEVEDLEEDQLQIRLMQKLAMLNSVDKSYMGLVLLVGDLLNTIYFCKHVDYSTLNVSSGLRETAVHIADLVLANSQLKEDSVKQMFAEMLFDLAKHEGLNIDRVIRHLKFSRSSSDALSKLIANSAF